MGFLAMEPYGFRTLPLGSYRDYWWMAGIVVAPEVIRLEHRVDQLMRASNYHMEAIDKLHQVVDGLETKVAALEKYWGSYGDRGVREEP